MNKLLKYASLFILTIAIGYITNTTLVYADDYPITCDLNFEVSSINDNGTFTQVGCYNTFGEAQNKMKNNEDFVVRSKKSLSPTKIVDMNSGYVYAYPARKNSATLSFYSQLTAEWDGAGVSTYTNSYNPIKYYSNGYYDEKKGYSRGWIYVSCHGFEGYTDLEGVDFVPMKYIKKSIPITLGGNQFIFDEPYNSEQPYKVICKANTYKAVRNGNYTDLLFTSYLGHSDNGGVGTSYSYRIGVAPSFMQLNVEYYSNDGVHFYSDIEEKNLAGTYYNYYQFLPLRTKTNISASTIDSYLSSHTNSGVLLGKGNEFKNNEALYGCNAAIVLSMAIHETGWGTSGFAVNRYNLFGINAYDHDPGKASYYDSTNDCIGFLMGDYLSNYMDVDSSFYYYTMSLGTKEGGFITKYASDMYWPEKISQFYYQLDKFDNNNNGNLTDYNSYNLSLVNTYNTDVKREANRNSQTLYTTAGANGYQKNLIVVNLGTVNEYTKTQLSNPINESNNVVHPITLPKGTRVTYDYNRSVGYILTSGLVPLNYSNQNPPEPTEKDPDPKKMEAVVSIDDLKLEGNTLKVEGIGAITYSHFKDLSKVKHELVIHNLDTDNEASFELTSQEYIGFGLNDGYTYKYVGFKGTIDLNQIINGSFKMMIRITNGEYVKEKEIRSNNFKYYNMTSSVGTITNKISSNPRFNYRLELEITDTPLDYSEINIVDNRPSLYAFDNFTLNLNEAKDNIDLHIDGEAFIYYTNYDVAENVTYTAYLVKDHEHYKELQTQRKTCDLDYNSIIKSSYNLTNICFEVNDTIVEDNLDDGQYKLILKIEKKDGSHTYIDYVEMRNPANYTLPIIDESTEGNTLGTYKALTSKVRDRMIIEVNKNETE